MFITSKSSNIFYQDTSAVDGEYHFTVTLSSAKLIKCLSEYGKHYVGLDLVWKYTKTKCPIWVLVVERPEGN